MVSFSSSEWSASTVCLPCGGFHNASLFLQLLLLERESGIWHKCQFEINLLAIYAKTVRTHMLPLFIKL